jgi:L-rhamnose mutarotase
VVCSQISQPNSKQSYKKHITDVVNASIKNNPYIVDNKEKYKDINNWQLFIDNKENRLCFVIWCINQDLYV